MTQALVGTRAKTRPMCIVCHERRARIGKKHGYPADLVCSQKCALNDLLTRSMDSKLCAICGEWTDFCGEMHDND